MKLFILAPRAKQDVNDIWDYIATTTSKLGRRIDCPAA
jgi:plasmid stabilization system protein ParE